MRGYLVAALAVALVAVPATGAVAASTSTAGTSTVTALTTQDAGCAPADGDVPGGRTGLLETLRSLSGTEAFSAYSEFEIVRSQAVLDVQAGEFGPADRQRLQRTVSLLRAFRRAYACRQAEQFNASLDAANRTADLAAGFSGATGQRIGALASVGLTRFYADLGEAVLSRGESLERTPARIAAFQDAALAFKRAGATQRFSRVSVRLDSVRREYRTDVGRYDNATATASSFLDDCSGCGGPMAALTANGLGVFGTYVEARGTRRAASRAVSLAEKHALDERAASARSLRDRVAAAGEALAVASAVLLVGFALLVGLVGGIVAWRLAAWRRDVEDARLGDVVLVGEMLDA